MGLFSFFESLSGSSLFPYVGSWRCGEMCCARCMIFEELIFCLLGISLLGGVTYLFLAKVPTVLGAGYNELFVLLNRGSSVFSMKKNDDKKRKVSWVW